MINVVHLQPFFGSKKDILSRKKARGNPTSDQLPGFELTTVHVIGIESVIFVAHNRYHAAVEAAIEVLENLQQSELQWPARNSDLNLIWNILARRVRERRRPAEC